MINRLSCGDLQRCRVEPSVPLFGDSCPGTGKYLEVHFKCLEVVEVEERWEPRFTDTQIRQLWDPGHKFISQEIVRASLNNNSIPAFFKDALNEETEYHDNGKANDGDDISQELTDHSPGVKRIYSTAANESVTNKADIVVVTKKAAIVGVTDKASIETVTDKASVETVTDKAAIEQKPVKSEEEFFSRRMTVIILIVLSCVALCLILLSYCSIKINKVKKSAYFMHE